MARERLAGDVDYEVEGVGYAVQRRTDPRIASLVHAALGDARTVLNVGAGAGSYEPHDRVVTAVEPSAAMRAQRPSHLAEAMDATAEALPFDDDSFDAAMATVTIHQWTDVDRGLRELRRVSRGPVVILTFDGDAITRFWLKRVRPRGSRDGSPSIPADRSSAGRARWVEHRFSTCRSRSTASMESPRRSTRVPNSSSTQRYAGHNPHGASAIRD